MQLRTLEVRNFRSIHDTERLEFNSGLTVILGPNNEGKSNLLNSVVLAARLLRPLYLRKVRHAGSNSEIVSRPIPEVYNWENDFPLGKQARYQDGRTVLKLKFQIQKIHEKELRQKFGVAIKNILPLTISIGRASAVYEVKKRGLGTLNPIISAEIAFYIGTHFSLEYIPAIRPGTMSVDVVSSLIGRQLNILRNDAEYVEAMDKVQSLQDDILKKLESDVQEQLQILMPRVSSVKIDGFVGSGLAPSRVRPFGLSLLIDDGTETDLEAKGDGVKSLVAIALMRSASSSAVLGGLLLAIEEPEAHLHPRAVRQISKVLREMATQHQVVITTHSPLLVARDSLSGNILITESKASVPTNIQEIREAIGVSVQDNLVDARNVLLVEGRTDQSILTCLAKYIYKPFYEALQNGTLRILALQGADNLLGHLRMLPELVVQPLLLLDGDPKGQEVGENAIAAGEIERRHVSYFKCAGQHYSELEDFLAPEFYIPIINRHFGVEITVNSFKNYRDCWGKKVKKSVGSFGKNFNKADEKTIKNEIVNAIEAHNNPKKVLCPDAFENLQSTIKALTEQMQLMED